jgi:DNA-binding beta-propeller fold protein YncE
MTDTIEAVLEVTMDKDPRRSGVVQRHRQVDRWCRVAIVIFMLSTASDAAANLLYVTSGEADDGVQVIDLFSNHVIDTVATGPGTVPIGLKLDPSARTLYVVNGYLEVPGCTSICYLDRTRGSVAVIDTATRTLSALIQLNNRPGLGAINPTGTRFYVSVNGTGGDQIVVIDTATNSIVDRFPTGPIPQNVAVHPSGDRLYVWTFMNGIQVFDTATDSLQATLLSNAYYFPIGALTFNQGGSLLYVNDHEAGTGFLSAIDTDTDLSSNAVVASAIGDLAVDAFGRRVYSVDLNGVVMYDSTSLVQLGTAGDARFPAFGSPLLIDPSGTTAYVETTGPFGSLPAEGISVVNLATGPGAIIPLPTKASLEITRQMASDADPRTGADLTAAFGFIDITVDPATTDVGGTLTFSPGAARIFGTTVDLHNSVGIVGLTGTMGGSNGLGSQLTLTGTGTGLSFQATGTLNCPPDAGCTDPSRSEQVNAVLQNIAGSVLPVVPLAGPLYTIEATCQFGWVGNLQHYTGTFILHAGWPTNMPAGSGVTVTSGMINDNNNTPYVTQVDVTFSGGTSGGTAFITPSWGNGPLPSNFRVGSIPVEIFTDASTVTPPILVCFHYGSTDPSSLTIEHFVNGTWVSLPTVPSGGNFASGKVCATVDSLSPFALGTFVSEDDGFVPPDNTSATCEATLDGALAGLSAKIAHCEVTTANAIVKGKPSALATCEEMARAVFDIKVGARSGCPQCVLDHAPVLADQVRTLMDTDLSAAAYCNGRGGIPFGGAHLGLIDTAPDIRTCEEQAMKFAGKLYHDVAMCHGRRAKAAQKGRAFDEELCESSAQRTFETKMLPACSFLPCIANNVLPLERRIEALVDGTSAEVHCAGSVPFGD